MVLKKIKYPPNTGCFPRCSQRHLSMNSTPCNLTTQTSTPSIHWKPVLLVALYYKHIYFHLPLPMYVCTYKYHGWVGLGFREWKRLVSAPCSLAEFCQRRWISLLKNFQEMKSIWWDSVARSKGLNFFLKEKKNVGLLDLDYSQIWLNPSKDDCHLAT